MKGAQKAQITELIDGIYYQKLGTILGTLQEWERSKADKIKQYYEHRMEGLLASMQQNQNQVSNELTQFIKVLNMQYSFLNRLRKEDKTPNVSQAFPDFYVFATVFGQTREAMLQLVQFLGKFIGVTNYEFVEIRKVYCEAEDIRKRLQEKRGKIVHSYNQNKEHIYSKRNQRKHFQLQKLLQLTAELPKQRSLLREFTRKIGELHVKQSKNRERMYQNVYDGLVHVSQLYEKVFKEDHLKTTREHFAAKALTARQYLESLGEYVLDQEDGAQLFKDLQSSFYSGFAEFLTEITVASWEVLFRGKEKEAVMPAALNFKPHSLRLTFDNKLLVMGEDKEVELEACLQDLKVSSANQEGQIEIKGRKGKEKCWVKFHTIEMEDEFILHYHAKVQIQ